MGKPPPPPPLTGSVRNVECSSQQHLKSDCSSLPFKGAVWKAIVDHKLMRAANEHFGSDYYQKLLSNCSPAQNLSTAAKQARALTD